MHKLFLIGAVLLATTAAHAGLSDNSRTIADTTQPSSEPPDDPAPAAKDRTPTRHEIMIQRRMAMQREMQRHPIRTRFQFGLLKLKRKLYFAFH
jgi:hypothetical protein